MVGHYHSITVNLPQVQDTEGCRLVDEPSIYAFILAVDELRSMTRSEIKSLSHLHVLFSIVSQLPD